MVTNLAHCHGRHVLVATDPTSAHYLVGSRDVAWHSQTTRWWSLPRREASNQLRVDIHSHLLSKVARERTRVVSSSPPRPLDRATPAATSTCETK